MEHKIRVLFLAANPHDTSRLSVDEEIRQIQVGIRGADFGQRFDVRSELALRPEELPAALMRHKPAIVHFSGHGSSDGTLCLVSDASKSIQPVDAEQLADVFKSLGGDIRCVVLSACYSANQAQALVRLVPCVVGMSQAVQDESAIAFSAGFYQALAFGESVQTAFELGRARIGLLTASEPGSSAGWWDKSRDFRKAAKADEPRAKEKEIPKLLCRTGVDPTKLVLLAPSALDNPWAAVMSSSGGGGGVGVQQVARFGNIKSSGKNNVITIGQLGNSGGSNATGPIRQRQEGGDIESTGEGNQLELTQDARYGVRGSGEGGKAALLKQGRELLEELVRNVAAGPLTPFQKKQAALSLQVLREQLDAPTLDRAVLSEVIEALQQPLTAVPADAQKLKQLSELLEQISDRRP